MVTAVELLERANAEYVKPIKVAGLDLCTRKFSLPEFLDLQKRIHAGTPPEPHEYLAIGLCNPDGSAFFTVEQACEFASKDGLLAAAIADRIADHAGLTVAAQERLTKN